jgi:SAM-dependent methyltransferase
MNLRYFALGVLRRQLPEQVLFSIMRYRGDGSVAETALAEYLDMWLAQLATHGHDLQNRRVLEVGSGRYARFALQLLAAGAQEVVLVDLYAERVDHPEHAALLQAECRRLGLALEDALQRIHVIRADITTLDPPSPSNSVDIVISHAVLEHVQDPLAILRCCYNWLAPNGFTSHLIDLRDHNLQFRRPFQMLTYADSTWRRWLDLRGGFHLNRWRVSDYVEACCRAGFTQVVYEPILQDLPALEAVYSGIDARFRSEPKQLLAIQKMFLSGTKPDVPLEH